MTDEEIIQLYWSRSDRAVAASEAAYGGYCYSVAYGVLNNAEDAEESVNDTWMAAWNAIPPTWPESLKAFFGQICRRLSITRLRRERRLKRGGGEADLVLDELKGCMPSGCDPQKSLEAKELGMAVNRFLAGLPERERDLFLARYWYMLPVREAARRLSMGTGAAKTALHRLRKRLSEQLQKEGLL